MGRRDADPDEAGTLKLTGKGTLIRGTVLVGLEAHRLKIVISPGLTEKVKRDGTVLQAKQGWYCAVTASHVVRKRKKK